MNKRKTSLKEEKNIADLFNFRLDEKDNLI